MPRTLDWRELGLTRRSLLATTALLASAGFVSACSGAPVQQGDAADVDGDSTSPSDATPSSAPASSDDTHGTRDDAVLTAPLDNGYDAGLHHAEISVAGLGTIALELDADSAPITVSNFADLADSGFYDGLTFHRIIKGFMVQGGDPAADGTGGSPQRIKGEFAENGVPNAILHKRGTISMARNSKADSASSQFFIVHQDAPSLNGKYAAFGHVSDDAGLAVVDALAEVGVQDSNGTVARQDQPRIEYVRMVD